ncbi:arginyltransferase [Acidiphilium sp.]|uniref:arginyltransferase n=1 Tax=Acidiphilium sp. TaxID=527 RepID=UPI003CFCB8EA
MTHSKAVSRPPQFFYATAPLPCPYLAGRTERKVVTELSGVGAEALHDRLSRGGFRRSHNIAYAPVCQGCRSCIPIRIVVNDFVPSRTQRRIAAMNTDLRAFEMPPRATSEQYLLFQRYQQARHSDGDMAAMSFYDYRAMVEDTPIETWLVEYRDGADRLVGACLTDRMRDGLSAVYSFFAPELARRSLGTQSILWLVERAAELGLPYVYLGYWVPESPKMAYKSRFRRTQILSGGVWIDRDNLLAGQPGALAATVTAG